MTSGLLITPAVGPGTGPYVAAPPEPVAPTITTTALGSLLQGVAFSQDLVATGDTPITFTVVSGALPAGTSLSSAGHITGTPTTLGSGSVTVDAANSIGHQSKALAWTVSPNPPVITTPGALDPMTVGTAFSQSLSASGSNPKTYALNSGTLPAGIDLSSAGVLSGTPTTAGSGVFVARVTNAGGYDDQEFAFTVASAGPHSVGRSGYSRRYLASQLADGTVTSWPSIGSETTDLHPSGTPAGTIEKMSESGLAFVRIDNAASGTTQLIDGGSATGGTVALVMRSSARVASDTDAILQGLRLLGVSASGEALRISPGTSTPYVQIGSFTYGAWHMILINVDVAAPVLRLDAAEAATVTSGPLTLATGGLTVRATSSATIDQKNDFAEIIVWPTTADATQRTAIHNALKAHYSVLP